MKKLRERPQSRVWNELDPIRKQKEKLLKKKGDQNRRERGCKPAMKIAYAARPATETNKP